MKRLILTAAVVNMVACAPTVAEDETAHHSSNEVTSLIQNVRELRHEDTNAALLTLPVVNSNLKNSVHSWQIPNWSRELLIRGLVALGQSVASWMFLKVRASLRRKRSTPNRKRLFLYGAD